MNIEVTDPIGALIIVAIVVIVVWLVAYSAARAATDDLRTVILSVATVVDGPTVVLEVANHGMKTAYEVTLGRWGAARGRPLASAGDIRPGRSATVPVERAALVEDSGEPLPSLVRLDWRIDGPQGPRKWNQQPLSRPTADTDGA